MPFFYVAAKIGTGETPRTAIRPDLPDNVEWVGRAGMATYIIRTERPLPFGHSATPVLDGALRDACNAHKAVYEDVTTRWATGPRNASSARS